MVWLVFLQLQGPGTRVLQIAMAACDKLGWYDYGQSAAPAALNGVTSVSAGYLTPGFAAIEVGRKGEDMQSKAGLF